VRGNSYDQGSIWTHGSFRLYRRREIDNFADAASRHRDFAQETPPFISEVRRMFTPAEIGAQLTRMEREQNQEEEDVLEEDDPLDEDPASIAERARRFAMIRELLTATTLGTS
jgi:hypothetical protein